MFLLNNMVLSKGSLKYPERLFHDIFILYFWYAFFCQCRSKNSREKSYSRINRFLSRFFKMKKFYSWKSLVKSSLHDHNRAAFIVKSFLPEVISRSQLPQNTKILYLCFRRRLLQNRHGSDWSITVCVILVSSYLVHELPLPCCMTHYMVETRNSYACSKSMEKTPDSFRPLRYGFFSVNIE